MGLNSLASAIAEGGDMNVEGRGLHTRFGDLDAFDRWGNFEFLQQLGVTENMRPASRAVRHLSNIILYDTFSLFFFVSPFNRVSAAPCVWFPSPTATLNA